MVETFCISPGGEVTTRFFGYCFQSGTLHHYKFGTNPNVSQLLSTFQDNEGVFCGDPRSLPRTAAEVISSARSERAGDFKVASVGDICTHSAFASALDVFPEFRKVVTSPHPNRAVERDCLAMMLTAVRLIEGEHYAKKLAGTFV